MKQLISIILSVLCALCVVAPATAFADEQQSASADGSTSSASTAPVSSAISDAIHKVALPLAAIPEESLFQRQYNWEAVENLNFESANEDGSLSEWQMDWYISHDWSDYGAVIANLEPGDAVTVNGRTILIFGRDMWPNDVINWDVYDTIGWDKVVFQTCLGDDAIWIAYGIPVKPTAEFLASHG